MSHKGHTQHQSCPLFQNTNFPPFLSNHGAAPVPLRCPHASLHTGCRPGPKIGACTWCAWCFETWATASAASVCRTCIEAPVCVPWKPVLVSITLTLPLPSTSCHFPIPQQPCHQAAARLAATTCTPPCCHHHHPLTTTAHPTTPNDLHASYQSMLLLHSASQTHRSLPLPSCCVATRAAQPPSQLVAQPGSCALSNPAPPLPHQHSQHSSGHLHTSTSHPKLPPRPPHDTSCLVTFTSTAPAHLPTATHHLPLAHAAAAAGICAVPSPRHLACHASKPSPAPHVWPPSPACCALALHQTNMCVPLTRLLCTPPLHPHTCVCASSPPAVHSSWHHRHTCVCRCSPQYQSSSSLPPPWGMSTSSRYSLWLWS
jgi:hypothetical protein